MSQVYEYLTIIVWILYELYNEQCKMSCNWLSLQKVVNTIGFFYLFSSSSSNVDVWGCVWVCRLWWLAETFTINRIKHLTTVFSKWCSLSEIFLLSQPKIILFCRNKQEQWPEDIQRRFHHTKQNVEVVSLFASMSY